MARQARLTRGQIIVSTICVLQTVIVRKLFDNAPDSRIGDLVTLNREDLIHNNLSHFIQHFLPLHANDEVRVLPGRRLNRR